MKILRAVHPSTDSPSLHRITGSGNRREAVPQITLKLRRIANMQVERRLADIQASRKINGALEPEQLDKWREIQQKTREGATK